MGEGKAILILIYKLKAKAQEPPLHAQPDSEGHPELRAKFSK